MNERGITSNYDTVISKSKLGREE